MIYKLRTVGKFLSIHHFLKSRFGSGAVLVFSLLIGIRLFNEVWSNTMVIGSYFGEHGSVSYYLSIIVFTVLTLAYTLKGGLRSSLLTDAIQLILFGILLFVLLGFIFPPEGVEVITLIKTGKWEMAAGLNLLFAAFLQVFSYPFHDPVLTDRGFVSSPSNTLKSYLIASVVGFVLIVLFGFVGVYAQVLGLKGQAAVELSKLLGIGAMLAMNFIMVTSAASTLDSSLSSFSKLVILDLKLKSVDRVKAGRWAMVVLIVLGTLPVFANPEILSATTISGTMVMGLAPVFLLWRIEVPKISFHLSVFTGLFVGVVLAFGIFPNGLLVSSGRYAHLLAANLWGLILCFMVYLAPLVYRKWKRQ